MIYMEHTTVYGFREAVRGMRNPLNSWDKSDSICVTKKQYYDGEATNSKTYEVGEKDIVLMRKLFNAGTDHRKFMRMITVYVDITAPLYWWKEFDTYKVGTVSNSCSTMHTIHKKPFTKHDFSTEHFLNLPDGLKVCAKNRDMFEPDVVNVSIDPTCCLNYIIEILNNCRDKYNETKDKKYWWQMIQLLPSSYNQKRTVCLNYEVLANIVKSRRHHKLDEWIVFCDWACGLPYFSLITSEVNNEQA